MNAILAIYILIIFLLSSGSRVTGTPFTRKPIEPSLLEYSLDEPSLMGPRLVGHGLMEYSFIGSSLQENHFLNFVQSNLPRWNPFTGFDAKRNSSRIRNKKLLRPVKNVRFHNTSIANNATSFNISNNDLPKNVHNETLSTNELHNATLPTSELQTEMFFENDHNFICEERECALCSCANESPKSNLKLNIVLTVFMTILILFISF
jgi:hypothetical protein